MALTHPGAALDAVYPAQPTRVAQIRRDVADVATGCGADETALLHINLAVSEAATNAVVHAYPDGARAGDVHVLVHHAGHMLAVRICDSGGGIAPNPDSAGMGLGWRLMAQEAQSFEVTTSPDSGTAVVLRFRI